MGRRVAFAGLLVAPLATAPAVLSGLTPTKFENFTATTTNLSAGNGEALRINVSTWTPAPEREKVVAALQKGEDQLLEVLREAPSHGYIWTSESLGYTLRYAHKMPLQAANNKCCLVYRSRKG